MERLMHRGRSRRGAQTPSARPARWVPAAALLLGSIAPASAQPTSTTWYVRPDGGSTEQCSGRVNAPHPGSGTGQPCAWDHPFRALPPGATPRIAGGDTLTSNTITGQGDGLVTADAYGPTDDFDRNARDALPDIGALESVAVGMAQFNCLFDWAERTYPTLFAPPGATLQTLAPYVYRHYPATQTYLGRSSTDDHVYYLGPLSGHAILDVGALADWLATAGCH